MRRFFGLLSALFSGGDDDDDDDEDDDTWSNIGSSILNGLNFAKDLVGYGTEGLSLATSGIEAMNTGLGQLNEIRGLAGQLG